MGLGLEKQPGHGRAEGQRVDGREEEREDDRQRELVVEPAGKPRDKGHGNEDGRQDERDRDDRRGDLGHGGAGGFERTGRPRSRYFSTFSTTMIASSTTRPIASTRPISVSVLIEKPNAAISPNVATSETGIATIGNQGGAEALQEDEHDDQTRPKASSRVCSTSSMFSLT